MISWQFGGFWPLEILAILGSLLWVALIAGVIFVVFRVANGSRRGEPRASESAEEVLRRRFAAGEIDEDEYRRRLDVLRRG